MWKVVDAGGVSVDGVGWHEDDAEIYEDVFEVTSRLWGEQIEIRLERLRIVAVELAAVLECGTFGRLDVRVGREAVAVEHRHERREGRAGELQGDGFLVVLANSDGERSGDFYSFTAKGSCAAITSLLTSPHYSGIVLACRRTRKVTLRWQRRGRWVRPRSSRSYCK